MKPIYYKAERFFPTAQYETHSKIIGREEIVSYDMILCKVVGGPDLDSATGYFGEVEDWRLLLKVPIKSDEQIIAYYKNPTESYEKHVLDSCFEFCGYDLSEEMTGISVITNCSGIFDKAVPYGELNKFGLLDDYNTAFYILSLMEKFYPDESHANCEVYELWRSK